MNLRKFIPKSPRIILLANGFVGLEISKFLVKSKEHIVGLILHSKGKGQFKEEIRQTVKTKNIFYANELNGDSLLSKINEIKPDIAISAWFGYILKKEFIDLFPCGCINFHNSYLPFNRGKYPHVWAINNTSYPYGVTIHFIDEGIDSGDILLRKKVIIKITDTAETVYDRSLIEIVKLFIRNWDKLKMNRIKPKRQSSIKTTHHFAKDIMGLDQIDLSKKYTGLEIINKLRSRSFSNRSYAYFMYKRKKIYIKVVLSGNHKFD